MDRRNFLQGVFGGVTAAGLIVSAKASEISAYAHGLAPNTPLLIDQPPAITPQIGLAEHLYNSRGELVAMVTDIMVTSGRQQIDVTSHWDSYVHRVAPEIQIRAIGIGRFELSGNAVHLRGV